MLFLHAPPLLPGLVASTVGYHATGRTPTVHRGLPSPYLTFIVSLDEPIISGSSPEQLGSSSAHRNDVLLAGLHTTAAYVRQPVQEAGIQVAVHPLAARALFGVPARELGTLTVEGSDVLGREVATLRERLLGEPGWPHRFDLLAAYLGARAEATGRAGEVRAELAEAWAHLARHHGALSVPALAEHVALSPRQLRTLFHREVGLGPKAVGRLMRFQRASGEIAAGIHSGRQQPLAKIASHSGYYDQPHLVREFRELTGISPSGWIAEERRNIQAGGHRNGEQWQP